MSSPSENSHSFANSTSPSQKMRKPRSSTSPATSSSSHSGQEIYIANDNQSIHDPDFHAFVRDQIPCLFRWWRIPENRATWARKQSTQQDIRTRTTSSRSSHRPTPYNRTAPGSSSVGISRQPTAARRYETPREIMNTKGKGKARAQDGTEYENVKFNEMHQSSLNPAPHQIGNRCYMLQNPNFNAGQFPNPFSQMEQTSSSHMSVPYMANGDGYQQNTSFYNPLRQFQQDSFGQPAHIDQNALESSSSINNSPDSSLAQSDYIGQSMDQAQSFTMGGGFYAQSHMENMNSGPASQTEHDFSTFSSYLGMNASTTNPAEQTNLHYDDISGSQQSAAGPSGLEIGYPTMGEVQSFPDNIDTSNFGFPGGPFQNFDTT